MTIERVGHTVVVRVDVQEAVTIDARRIEQLDRHDLWQPSLAFGRMLPEGQVLLLPTFEMLIVPARAAWLKSWAG